LLIYASRKIIQRAIGLPVDKVLARVELRDINLIDSEILNGHSLPPLLNRGDWHPLHAESPLLGA
jgi:hypothetical protein